MTGPRAWASRTAWRSPKMREILHPQRALQQPRPLIAPAAAGRGVLYRYFCQRMVNQDRNVFAASMVARRMPTPMVTGPVTRAFATTPGEKSPVSSGPQARALHPVSAFHRHPPVDAPCCSPIPPCMNWPSAEEMAGIAHPAAAVARQHGQSREWPFLLIFSNFGNPQMGEVERIRDAVHELEPAQVDFRITKRRDAAQWWRWMFEQMRPSIPFCRPDGLRQCACWEMQAPAHAAHPRPSCLQQLAAGRSIAPCLCCPRSFRPISVPSTRPPPPSPISSLRGIPPPSIAKV